MREQRQTRITVETHRRLILRRSQSVVQAWCQGCASQVEMLPAEQAAAVASVSCRTIYRRVEAEKVHFVETGDGRIVVCLNSLIAVQANSTNPPAGDRLRTRPGTKREKKP